VRKCSAVSGPLGVNSGYVAQPADVDIERDQKFSNNVTLELSV
jgi:hypothetical protein